MKHLGKISIVLTIVVMLCVSAAFFTMMSTDLGELVDTRSAIISELSTPAEKYTQMAKDREPAKKQLEEQVEAYRAQHKSNDNEDASSGLISYRKEDVVNKISESVASRELSLQNFYVTRESDMYSDYSVEICGRIKQLNLFVQDICSDCDSISIGEFSLREDINASYLVRRFDASNALSWYDGNLGLGDIEPDNDQQDAAEEASGQDPEQDNFETRLTDAEIKSVLSSLKTKTLPKSDDISYVLTITFRL